MIKNLYRTITLAATLTAMSAAPSPAFAKEKLVNLTCRGAKLYRYAEAIAEDVRTELKLSKLKKNHKVRVTASLLAPRLKKTVTLKPIVAGAISLSSAPLGVLVSNGLQFPNPEPCTLKARYRIIIKQGKSAVSESIIDTDVPGTMLPKQEKDD